MLLESRGVVAKASTNITTRFACFPKGVLMKSINGFSIRQMFCLAFGFGLLVGCSNAPADNPASESSNVSNHDSASNAILNVMRRDDEISAEIDPEPSWDTTEYVRYIVGAMKENDTVDCPEQFSEAYTNHVEAWQNLLRTVMDNHSQLPTLAEYGSLTALHGTSARDDLERELFAAWDEVNETFDECTNVAKAHGISKSEYDLDR